MKRTRFILLLLITFLAEILLVINFTGKIILRGQDTVAVNDCVKSVENNFGNESAYSDALKYVILGSDGQVIYQNSPGLSKSLNEAIKKGDLILDF